jgi:hypothetical protein
MFPRHGLGQLEPSYQAWGLAGVCVVGPWARLATLGDARPGWQMATTSPDASHPLWVVTTCRRAALALVVSDDEESW